MAPQRPEALGVRGRAGAMGTRRITRPDPAGAHIDPSLRPDSTENIRTNQREGPR